MRALILVDIQNDFLPGGALAVPEGDRVIPVANRVQRYFELVLATQDWHPPEHGSFAANHPGREPGELIDLGGIPQVLWPLHCIQNSRGAELSSALETSRIRKIFCARGPDRTYSPVPREAGPRARKGKESEIEALIRLARSSSSLFFTTTPRTNHRTQGPTPLISRPRNSSSI